MKRIIIAIIIAVITMSCAAPKNYKGLCEQQERLIQCYENVLDSIYKEDSNLFLDVYMETDWYLDYTIEYQKYLKMKEKMK